MNIFNNQPGLFVVHLTFESPKGYDILRASEVILTKNVNIFDGVTHKLK